MKRALAFEKRKKKTKKINKNKYVKKMAKDKQTNIWGYMPEVENDIKIIKTVCKLGGLSEDETNKEINKLKINKEKQDEYSKLLGRQNAVKYQISGKIFCGVLHTCGICYFPIL